MREMKHLSDSESGSWCFKGAFWKVQRNDVHITPAPGLSGQTGCKIHNAASMINLAVLQVAFVLWCV